MTKIIHNICIYINQHERRINPSEKLTNHRGDSGIKKSPGISTRQGKVPVMDKELTQGHILHA